MIPNPPLMPSFPFNGNVMPSTSGAYKGVPFEFGATNPQYNTNFQPDLGNAFSFNVHHLQAEDLQAFNPNNQLGPSLIEKFEVFSLFHDFPQEIQDKIFECMFPGPRTEHLGLLVHESYGRRQEYRVELPITLLICQRSRYITFLRYTIIERPKKIQNARKIYGFHVTKIYGTENITQPRPLCIGPHDTLAISADIPKWALKQTLEWLEYLDMKIPGGLKSIKYLELRDNHTKSTNFLEDAVALSNVIGSFDFSPLLPSIFTNGILDKFSSLEKLTLTNVEKNGKNRHALNEEERVFLWYMIADHLDKTTGLGEKRFVETENIEIKEYERVQGKNLGLDNNVFSIFTTTAFTDFEVSRAYHPGRDLDQASNVNDSVARQSKPRRKQSANVYHNSSIQPDPFIRNDVDHLLVDPRALVASVERVFGDYRGYIQVNVSPNISPKLNFGRNRDHMTAAIPFDNASRHHDSRDRQAHLSTSVYGFMGFQNNRSPLGESSTVLALAIYSNINPVTTPDPSRMFAHPRSAQITNSALTNTTNHGHIGASSNSSALSQHPIATLQPSQGNMSAFEDIRQLQKEHPRPFDLGYAPESGTKPMEPQEPEGYGYGQNGSFGYYKKNSYKFPAKRITLQEQQKITDRLNEMINVTNTKRQQLRNLLIMTGPADKDSDVRFELLSQVTPVIDFQRLKKEFRLRKKCDWQQHGDEKTAEENQDPASGRFSTEPFQESITEATESLDQQGIEAISSSSVDMIGDSETTVLAIACEIQESWKCRRYADYVEPAVGSMQRYAERAINPIFTGVSLIPKDQSRLRDLTADERRNCLRAAWELLQKAMATAIVPDQLRVLYHMFQDCSPSPTSGLSYPSGKHSHVLLKKCDDLKIFLKFPVEIQRMIFVFMFPGGRSEPIDFTTHPTQRRAGEQNIELPITLRICKVSREVTQQHYTIVHKPVGKGIPERKFYGKVYNKSGADPEKLSYPRPFCYNPEIDTLCISYDFRAPKVSKQICKDWYDKVHDALMNNRALRYVGLKGVRFLDVRDVLVRLPINQSDISWFLPTVYADGFLSRFENLHKLFFTSAGCCAWQNGHTIIDSPEKAQLFKDKVTKYLKDTKDAHGGIVAEKNLIVRQYEEPQGKCALATWQPKEWRDFEEEFISKMATHVPNNMK
ncbi:hypothetical protein OCU04_003856 [Sclerotinia nivalis]|uniref:2EXR domain-containing protein n=1 Tax=Sclerotinia nivalis TaxID=352851 RepID=A0A9X0AW97_9HELO|nr:hypothetical protein OCU04_003856 [Sclerotinia nivalis]